MTKDLILLQENAAQDYERKAVQPQANSVLSFDAAKNPTTTPIADLQTGATAAQIRRLNERMIAGV